ncbi:RHS Repeat protein [compost metagenome]
MGTVTYDYEVSLNSNIYTVNYPNSSKQRFKRNSFKELIDVSDDNGVSGLKPTETFTYDGFGNINALNRGNRLISFNYDKLNRISQENYPQGQVYYSYDERGNRVVLESDVR